MPITLEPLQLDPQTVAALRRLDRDGTLRKRLADALGRTLQRLNNDWQSSDRERLRRAAHTLRAAAVQLGASALATRCQQLEAQALQAPEEALNALLQPLPDELAAFTHAVQTQL